MLHSSGYLLGLDSFYELSFDAHAENIPHCSESWVLTQNAQSCAHKNVSNRKVSTKTSCKNRVFEWGWHEAQSVVMIMSHWWYRFSFSTMDLLSSSHTRATARYQTQRLSSRNFLIYFLIAWASRLNWFFFSLSTFGFDWMRVAKSIWLI